MKKFLYNLLILTILLTLGACTNNGGPDGPLYGRWHLERIEADNMDTPAQAGEIFLSFQSNTVMLQRDNGKNHSVSSVFGNFRLEDNTLFLDFPEENQPPFPQTGLGRQNMLQILKITHRDLTLLYVPDAGDAPGATLTYYFKKW